MAAESLQELRYSVMLLALLTEANSGHPTLHNPLFAANQNRAAISSESSASESTARQLKVLRDFAICCIRNNQIIAAASGYSEPTEPRTLPGAVLCKNERHDHFDRFQDLSNFPDFTKIFTINNPDGADKYFSSLDSEQDICSIVGQSYWSLIPDTAHWTFVTTDPR